MNVKYKLGDLLFYASPWASVGAPVSKISIDRILIMDNGTVYGSASASEEHLFNTYEEAIDAVIKRIKGINRE